MRSFRRVLKLRAGDEREALIASFIESHWDPAHFPPFADLDVDADISVPLPGAEPGLCGMEYAGSVARRRHYG